MPMTWDDARLMCVGLPEDDHETFTRKFEDYLNRLSALKESGYQDDKTCYDRHHYLCIKDGYLICVHDPVYDEDYNMTIIKDADGEEGACCPGKNWFPTTFIDREGMRIITRGSRECEPYITAVYGRTRNRYLMDNSTEHRKLIWKRPDIYTGENMYD